MLVAAGKELEQRVDTDRAANARLPQLLTVHFQLGQPRTSAFPPAVLSVAARPGRVQVSSWVHGKLQQ